MTTAIHDLLSFTFLQRAVLAGVLIALCAALLGVSLVLKRYSMLSDGLSHVGFGALAIATVAGISPLPVAIPVVVACAFLLLRMGRNASISGDSATALLATGSLAVGVMAISLKKGVNIDINNYMFGSILATSKSEVILSAVLCASVLALYALFYNRIFSVTFDESFAAATGVRTGRYNALLAVLVAVTVTLGMRLMGALLISSLVVFPALTAMRLCKTYRSVLITACALSVFCFLVGITLSYLYATPAGASVVCVNIAAFAAASLAAQIRKTRG